MGFDTNLKLTCRVLVNLKVYNFVYQFKMVQGARCDFFCNTNLYHFIFNSINL